MANNPSPEDMSDLYKAIQTGDKTAVETFFDYFEISADILRLNSWTTLMHAAWYGKKDIAEILLRYGALVDTAQHQFGDTALILAAKKGNKDVVAFLLKNGAVVDKRTPTENRTALIFAALAPDRDTVAQLLEAGADINAKDTLGHTALMYAAMAGDKETVTLLLERGASVDDKDRDGKTALTFAREFERIHVVGREQKENHADVQTLLEQALLKEKQRQEAEKQRREQEELDKTKAAEAHIRKRFEKLREKRPVKIILKKEPPPKP